MCQRELVFFPENALRNAVNREDPAVSDNSNVHVPVAGLILFEFRVTRVVIVAEAFETFRERCDSSVLVIAARSSFCVFDAFGVYAGDVADVIRLTEYFPSE